MYKQNAVHRSTGLVSFQLGIDLSAVCYKSQKKKLFFPSFYFFFSLQFPQDLFFFHYYTIFKLCCFRLTKLPKTHLLTVLKVIKHYCVRKLHALK